MRAALTHDEFVLHYQPKVQLNSGRVSGVEALLRWQRPDRGLVAPGEFIPVLEETGLIVDVGSWVIDAACRQIALWLRSPVGPMPVSVNVSGRQFIEGDLSGDVLRSTPRPRRPSRPARVGVDGELAHGEHGAHHRRP